MKPHEMAAANEAESYRYKYIQPTPIKWTRPNFDRPGYGMILKILSSNGPHYRYELLEAMGRPAKCGYYSATFQRLRSSGLVAVNHNPRGRSRGIYQITALGKAFLNEYAA